MPEPRVGCEILWVSSLAYPNLFGTKGFVVVVVVMPDQEGMKAKPGRLEAPEGVLDKGVLGRPTY